MSYFQHVEYNNFEKERNEKERLDLQIFEAGIQHAAEHTFDKLQTLFIYAGNYYRFRTGLVENIFRLDKD